MRELNRHRERAALVGALLTMLALIAVSAAVPDAGIASPTARLTATPTHGRHHHHQAAPATTQTPKQLSLPHGEHTIFGINRFLVAYYGTAGTGSLGVLGDTDPDTAFRRIMRAARPFARQHSPVQAVYELIVTVADGYPGRDGSFSHDIPKAEVQRYIEAAHRHGALLLLDIQPGRDSFQSVAKRWGWALHDPYVGLALDPEWRMGRHGIPAERVGSVDAAEVNHTSAWLRDLVRRNHLPQKLFVLHQFRTDMIRDIGAVKPRAGLVMVQHVDGFGTPGQKLGTFDTVVRPGQFVLGFKLFYHQDVHRMSPAEVRHIRPRVRFVSFQ